MDKKNIHFSWGYDMWIVALARVSHPGFFFFVFIDNPDFFEDTQKIYCIKKEGKMLKYNNALARSKKERKKRNYMTKVAPNNGRASLMVSQTT